MADNSDKVKDIIEKELGVEREKLTNEASFIEDLGADSLDIVELVMEFEKEFNIDIPDEDAEKLRTVGDALGYLNRRSGVMKRRVVVTGMGAITPVGNDVATTWRSLIEGKSGTTPITQFDASKFTCRIAAEVKDFNPLDFMDRKEAKRADQYTQYAVAGARQAMTDASLVERNGMDPDRIGVIIGSGIGGLKSFEEQHDVYRERGVGKISPFFIPMFIADIAAGIVSMQFNAKGPKLRHRISLRD